MLYTSTLALDLLVHDFVHNESQARIATASTCRAAPDVTTALPWQMGMTHLNRGPIRPFIQLATLSLDHDAARWPVSDSLSALGLLYCNVLMSL